MAKEVLANEKYAEPADVYSFGVIMWELLTRECPFEGMTQIQVAMAVLNDGKTVVVPAWFQKSMPRLNALIERCLSSDPRRRPSFSEILRELEV